MITLCSFASFCLFQSSLTPIYMVALDKNTDSSAKVPNHLTFSSSICGHKSPRIDDKYRSRCNRVALSARVGRVYISKVVLKSDLNGTLYLSKLLEVYNSIEFLI